MLKKTINDRPPNFRDEKGNLFLVRCYSCEPGKGRENYIMMVASGHSPEEYARQQYRKVWDSIYSNWQDNPWVWVIDFKRQQNDRENQGEGVNEECIVYILYGICIVYIRYCKTFYRI